MNPIEPASSDHIYAASPAAINFRALIWGGDSMTVQTSSLPLCASPATTTTFMKTLPESNSDLTYYHNYYNYNLQNTLPSVVSRKRPRDSQINIDDPFISKTTTPQNCTQPVVLSFLGEDVSVQILKQQELQIERFISQHMEKVRVEMEERRKRQSRRIIAAVEAGVMERLRAKEEEIEKICKLNWALEERLRSLYEENQIWKGLAHTNEATVQTLQQALTEATAANQCRYSVEPVRNNDGEEEEDDGAESCCGSTTIDREYDVTGGGGGKERRRRRRWCRKCGKEEAGVLLLPCRHLCLCTTCGPTLHTCPICNARKNASVHVNFS